MKFEVASLWSPRSTTGGVRLYSAALLTLGAAFIHLAAAPAHLREWLPFGVFFLAVGAAQIVLTVEVLTRPTRKLAAAMAVGSLALVALWFVSRTSGLPFGPTPNVPEDIGFTDIICTTLEIISAILFVALAIWPAHCARRRFVTLGVASLPSAALATALTLAAVTAEMSGMPAAVNASAAVAPGQTARSLATLTEAPGSEPVDRFTLTAQVATIDGQDVWTYNGVVPGPELRVTQGHRVQITLVNNLPESTTLHWHGLQLPNAEDGVAGLTQDAVPSGSSYTYEFVAREAGTFWYHSHQQTEQQLPRGLFGALVIEPANGRVAQDYDYALVLHGTGGSQVSANGAATDLQLAAQPGETVRLRVVNAVVPGMDGGPEAPMLIGAPFKVVALDGRDLNDPALLGPTRVPLGMGQRADLVFTMPARGSVRLVDTELVGETSPVQQLFSKSQQVRMATVTVGSGDAPTLDAASAPLFDLTQYGTSAPDPVAVTPADLTVPIVLDKHPGIRYGRPQLIHTINGLSAPDTAPIVVTEGQVVHLHIVNNSEEYHPMHLHGHLLSVIARGGQAIAGSPVHLDSLLVGPHETWDVAFAADNPGIWMFHCHVLLHAGMGMTTNIVYGGITTPYDMGTDSGNMPE